jgi:hypothetical protein
VVVVVACHLVDVLCLEAIAMKTWKLVVIALVLVCALFVFKPRRVLLGVVMYLS